MPLGPTKTLPPEFKLIKKLDIRERKSAVVLNLLGVVLLVLAWWFFTWLVGLIRPGSGADLFSFQVFGIWETLAYLGEVILVVVAMLVVHEALHGVFFWWYTKNRPKFAFKIYYAYAAAPDWYMPKRAYLVTALAPLIGISLAGLVLTAFVSDQWVPPLLWMMVLNASGAVGDLWVVLELLRSPADTYGRDHGDMVELFTLTKQAGQ